MCVGSVAFALPPSPEAFCLLVEVTGVFLNRLGTLPKSANPSDPDLIFQRTTV